MSISGKVGKYAYVPSHIQFFRNRGQYFARGVKTPKAGDVIFFGTSGAHVGLVEKVSGSLVYTVEGNTSGASGLVSNGGGVCRKSYYLTSSYILGYGRPAYTSGEAEKILSVAIAEIGYLEKQSNSQLDSKTANAGSANYNKYARDIWPSLQAQPWCDIFVSWCAIQADKAGASVSPVIHTFDSVKTWKNGSTEEIVYADSGLTVKIGSLDPYESCQCFETVNGRYHVRYAVDGSAEYKAGFVEYAGGVTD